MKRTLITLGLVGLASFATAQGAEDEPLTLREALGNGKSWVKMRVRFEQVDQDGFTKDANAFTVRTLIGYETGVWNDFSILLEAEDVQAIGSDSYNSTTNANTSRPVVADPDGTETNQAYVQFTGLDDTTIRAGRQRITLGDHRFVGNVGWRQNEQTFDAWSVETTALDGFDVFYAFVSNVNRVFGEQNPAGDAAMASHLFNIGHDFEGIGRLEAYLYDLDYDVDAGSTRTIGASFGGKQEMEEIDLLYRLAFADQQDAHNNAAMVDAGYTNIEAGVGYEGFTVKIGQEVLEATDGSNPAFSTPLATLHKFNGWADQFLATPVNGLEDTYISFGGKIEKATFAVVYHDFSSELGSTDYGDELDLVVTRELCAGVTGGIKYADFSGDPGFSDVTKMWLWFGFSF